MIRTVLGDISPDLLGAMNYHEHLFQVSPLLPGDELDDERASGAEAALLKASGFAAMLDATPIGLGRNPEALARISASTGLTIVATTGLHREAHYDPSHPAHTWSADERASRFVSDLTAGMPVDDAAPTTPALDPHGNAVRAGALKCGIDYWRISPFERTTISAVGAAHHATGAAVMVHLEYCTAAHEVLDVLADEGVRADRVVLAHADRDVDAGLHVSLIERGAYLGYDGFARARTRSDAELLALTDAVVSAAGAERILLGGDVARRSRYIAYGGMPGLSYLGERYLPRLRERIGDSAVETMISTNPARLLSMRDAA